jgi:hypothetical protein
MRGSGLRDGSLRLALRLQLGDQRALHSEPALERGQLALQRGDLVAVAMFVVCLIMGMCKTATGHRVCAEGDGHWRGRSRGMTQQR